MNTTPVSLLERLRLPEASAAWPRFVDLYTPLLYHWSRRLGLQQSDAEDLVQEVMMTLLKEMPCFTYQEGKRFRGWLWTVLINKWRQKQRRRAGGPHEVGDRGLAAVSADDDVEEMADAEYQTYLVQRALELIQAEFRPQTWKACWEYVVAGRPAAEVAAELGLTVNAVHLAKSRVLRRLRQELAGLLD
jgi:RNA polymerase sigma-70 factor (ECF subfamily)